MEAVGVADDPSAGGVGARIRRRATAEARPAATPLARSTRRRRRSARRRTTPGVSRQRPSQAARCSSRMLAALRERHAERVVLVAVPADRRLDDEPALVEQVERAELAGEQQRVAQRGDHGPGGEPHARRRGGDRREQDERARPGHRRVLVPRHRVVARVPHDPLAPALGPSTMCSLTITASKPASSATTAISTSPRRSRGGVSVQFSLSTRTSLMLLSAALPRRAPRTRRSRRVGEAAAPGPGRPRGRRTDRRSRP